MSVKFKIESGVQLLARLTKKPNVEKFYPPLFQDGPSSGDIIEIFGDTSTSTSHLMIDLISEALIQTRLNRVPAGILIFDTDGSFDYDKLLKVIHRKVWSLKFTDKSPEDIELNKEIYQILTNLHILNIYDATQFYATIFNLENTLIDHPNISIIFFNNLTAFYWSEQGFKITKMDLYTKNVINKIQKVTKEYKTICVYTRPEYFCTNKETENIPAEISYQIQLLDKDKGYYQVTITTLHKKITKFFRMSGNDLTWIKLDTYLCDKLH